MRGMKAALPAHGVQGGHGLPPAEGPPAPTSRAILASP